MPQRLAIIQVQRHQKKVEKEAVRCVFHVSRRAGTVLPERTTCLHAAVIH